jgi:hypothetical protein
MPIKSKRVTPTIQGPRGGKYVMVYDKKTKMYSKRYIRAVRTNATNVQPETTFDTPDIKDTL